MLFFPALAHLILFFPQWLDWHCGKMISVMRDFCQGRYRQLHIHWKWENISDGKKMTVQDVVYGKRSSVKKKIADTYARKITRIGYKYIMKMKYSDIDFYVKPGKKYVYVLVHISLWEDMDVQ